MFKIQRSIFLILLIMGLFLAVQVQAADNSCRIMAGRQNDVWVQVYDADAEGNRNQMIWEGKIEAGNKITVHSTDGHIRYNYKLDHNQPYQGDLSRGCFNKMTIEVP